MKALLERITHHVVTTPDAIALQDGEYRLSYRLLWSEIWALVPQLVAWSGPQRRPLALAMDNGWRWVVTDLAAALTDIPLVPLPPFFTEQQRQHVLKDSGCIGLVLAQDDAFVFLPCQSQAVTLPPGCCKITYTSGTTGQPKGVCLCSSQLDATLMALAERIAPIAPLSHLCTMPLAVLLENLAGVYLPLWLGKRIELCPMAELGLSSLQQPNPARFIQRIASSGAESLILLPATLNWLVGAVAGGMVAAERWKLLAVGGGKCARDLLLRAQNLQLPLFEGYGLSEVGSVVALNGPQASSLGSVGKPLSHVEVAIAEDGEVLVRGNIMLGYLGAEPHAGDWLATGDLGELDSQGFLHIHGRKKSTIVTGFGRNVSPEWLEAELLALPGVLQAFVYGDEQLGIGALLFAPAVAGSPQADALLASCNQQLPSYARIGQWQFIDTPLSAERGELTANGRLRREHILQTRINLEIES